EDCDIFSSALDGVRIYEGGNPILRRCLIHDGKGAGVHVYQNGVGTLEDCDIFRNGQSGIKIKQGGDPLVQRCRINHNAQQAVRVYENGAGTVEDCDLTNNTSGSWDIALLCRLRVRRSGNKE
ncbi:MAG: right-handed parallel beta-helix repeat-containing protein, partial [Nitrospira sp.]|nr:right-handed parallel beta-helix repeat-containing protein [Nitrospira sp.]